MLLSLPPRSRTASSVGEVILKLRAEQSAARSEHAKARLLYEIGVLEESIADEASAAGDLLAAVNLVPELREPLERLIAIVEKRRSFKNLGKLIARLEKIAGSLEEEQRALLAKAAFLEDHENDLTQARATLERLLEAEPADGAAWLMLESIAAKLGDVSLRLRALQARADAAVDPAWRALLLADLGRAAKEQNASLAITALKLAISLKTDTTFASLRALEQVARETGQIDGRASALEGETRLIENALEASQDSPFGVPHYLASPFGLADAALRGARVHLERNDAARAAGLLDQARARLPDDATLNSARILVADAAGDTAVAAQIAEEELKRGVTGEAGAALWLRIAEARMTEGSVPEALAALDQALGLDPECIVALALRIDLLGVGGSPEQLARAWDDTTQLANTNAAKARYLLVAAEIWAREVGNANEAKERLARAAALGTSKKTLARVARTLAAATDNLPWYLEATADLVESGVDDKIERTSLWFELLRARLLAADFKGTEAALGQLASDPSLTWFAAVLRAYFPAVERAASDQRSITQLDLLTDLARHATTPEVAQAIRLASAWRAQLGGAPAVAIQILKALQQDQPENDLVAAYLASLLRAQGDLAGASRILGGVSDDSLALALQLETLMLRWLGGDRRHAIEELEQVAEKHPEFPATVLAWCRGAERPNDPKIRHDALEQLRAADDIDGLYDLELFALEARPGGDGIRAEAALDRIDNSEDPGIAGAAVLARALWAPAESVLGPDRLSGLRAFGATGATQRTIALASSYLEALAADAPPEALEQAARLWAAADRTLAPALEWLATTLRARNPHAEIEARTHLIERMPDAERLPIEVSARLGALLLGEKNLPFMDPRSEIGQLANSELGSPGSAPELRAQALSGLARVLPEDEQPVHDVMIGWNLVAAGHFERAEACFRRAVEIEPEDVIGWGGLRAIAEATVNRELMVEALAALGDTTAHPERAVAFWEQAGNILIDELGDDEQGLLALARAASKDMRHFSSFDRLFRGVCEKGDNDWVVELADARLLVAEDSEERVALFWEKAKALRQLGDYEATLATLDNLLLLDPRHVDALTLAGEVHLSRGSYQEAVEKLVRLAEHPGAPPEQRLLSAIAAVDVLENKLEEPEQALSVLNGITQAGLATLPVRERLARLAAKTEAWEQAATAFTELMTARTEAEGRIEAARLALAIYRDRVNEPAKAAAAVEVLLDEAPEDGEAIDLILTGVFDKATSERSLKDARMAIVAALRANPDDIEQVLRLATVAEALDDLPLKQIALGVALASGHGNDDIERQLASLDRRVSATPQLTLSPVAFQSIHDPLDTGPITELFRLLGPTLTAAFGPNLESLGVGKKQRVKSPTGIPVCNEVVAWAGALGIGGLEFYIGGNDANGLTAVAGEPAAFVIGEGVRVPFNPGQREAVARELFALSRGTLVLRHRSPIEIAAIVVAACRAGGVKLTAPQYSMLDEFERQLTRELPRRHRKPLQQLAAEIAQSEQSPMDWVLSANASADRMAAIATGDVSWVVANFSATGRGERPQTQALAQRAHRLFGFVFSPALQELRKELGMEVR